MNKIRQGALLLFSFLSTSLFADQPPNQSPDQFRGRSSITSNADAPIVGEKNRASSISPSEDGVKGSNEQFSETLDEAKKNIQKSFDNLKTTFWDLEEKFENWLKDASGGSDKLQKERTSQNHSKNSPHTQNQQASQPDIEKKNGQDSWTVEIKKELQELSEEMEEIGSKLKNKFNQWLDKVNQS